MLSTILTHLRRLAFESFVGSPLCGGPLRVVVLRALGMTVGDRTSLRAGCRFIGGENVTFGRGCYTTFGLAVQAEAPITFGDRVMIGSNVLIVSASHRIGPSEQRVGSLVSAPIVIEDGCWIGANATVLPGVTIGRGCVVAAGAVVHRDCAPDGLYAGVPARRVRDLDPAGEDSAAAAAAAVG